MGRKRTYTDAERAQVLAVWASCGKLRQTSRETGVAYQTVCGWVKGTSAVATKPELQPVVTADKAALADRLEAKLDQFVEAMSPQKIEKASLLQLTTSTGILADKIRLLRLDALPAQHVIAGIILECVSDPAERLTIAHRLNDLYRVSSGLK